MCKKNKKYQYLYLREKLFHFSSEKLLYDIGSYTGWNHVFNRLDFYYDWLTKINKRYEYEKNFSL